MTGCDLIVMPFSRSKSMASKSWALASRSATVCVNSKRRSERVVFPWSICAMMEKLRVRLVSMKKFPWPREGETLESKGKSQDGPAEKRVCSLSDEGEGANRRIRPIFAFFATSDGRSVRLLSQAA